MKILIIIIPIFLTFLTSFYFLIGKDLINYSNHRNLQVLELQYDILNYRFSLTDKSKLKYSDKINVIMIKNNIDNMFRNNTTPGLHYPADLNTYLSENQLQIVTEAQNHSNRIKELVWSFEGNLSKKDIEFITQDNPDSLYNEAEIFSTIATLNKCTKKDYEEIKDYFQPLNRNSSIQFFLLRSLCLADENKDLSKYIKKIIKLIKNDKIYSKSFKTLIPYYELSLEIDHLNKSLTNISNSIQNLNRVLPAPNKDEQQMSYYYYGLCEKYFVAIPKCQISIDIDFLDFFKIDFTRIQGEKLLEYINNYIVEKNIRKEALLNPDFIDNLIDNTSDFSSYEVVEEFLLDSWQNEFEIRRKDSNYHLYSFGPDEDDIDDDINVGKLNFIPLLDAETE
ncbi:hypothetical protein BVY03_03200 [bacterium K02(2017)]|nr:hypothetical protein BVY03_03200 [bacterium K02(2017)]